MEVLIKFVVFFVLIVIGFWRGRRNERERLRQLDKDEERLASVMIFATRYPAITDRAMDPVMVSGSVVLGSDYFRLFLANLRKVVGGNYRAYETLLDSGRRQAVLRMKQSAKDLGANMIFNVQYSTCRISNSHRNEANQVEVLAYGTAFVPARGAISESLVHHQPGYALPETDLFSLMSNKVSKRWILGWFVLVAYCFIGLFSDNLSQHRWRYATGAPWYAYGIASTAVASWLWWKARRTAVPIAESIVLWILTLPTFIFSLYFAALQINNLTAGESPPTRYTVTANARLMPEDRSKPALVLADYADYWSSQRTGTVVEIPVKRGWLGFYQYDLGPLADKYRAYYQRQHNK